MTMDRTQQLHDQSSIDRRCGQSNMTEQTMGQLRTANKKHNRAITFATRTIQSAKAAALAAVATAKKKKAA